MKEGAYRAYTGGRYLISRHGEGTLRAYKEVGT